MSKMNLNRIAFFMISGMVFCTLFVGCKNAEKNKTSTFIELLNDTSLQISTRAEIALELAHCPGNSTIQALSRYVPGDGDVITRNAIYSLGEVGDASSLQLLKNYFNNAHIISGQIGVATDNAIKKLEKKINVP